MENLIPIVIFVIVVLANVLKKRGQQEEEDSAWPGEESPGRGTPPAAPGAPRNWEEELRRLLEGETPAPKPPPIVPPVAREAPRTPPPMRPARSQPPPPPRSVYTPPASTPAREAVHEFKERVADQLADLRQSARETRAKAAQFREALSERVTPLSEEMGAPGIKAAGPRRAGVSADAQAAIRLVRNPRTVRQALIASVILNPPKALERMQDRFA